MEIGPGAPMPKILQVKIITRSINVSSMITTHEVTRELEKELNEWLRENSSCEIRGIEITHRPMLTGTSGAHMECVFMAVVKYLK